jgi:polyisoprenoid-binding protein YceI
MVQATREIEGVALPPVGKWEIDPAHSTIGFVARHVLSKTRGKFGSFSGAFTVAERPEASSVEVEIDAASIESGTPDRDTHLRSPDFMDVERFPKLLFRSTQVRLVGGNRFELVGDLTIKDVTREVVFQGEFDGWQPDAFGNTVAAFTASTELDREDFGITWNVVIETGGLLVGKKVRVELEIEAVYKG